MSVWEKAKAMWSGATSATAAAANPVSAIAGAVGGIANAVTAVEQKSDHKQMLDAGAAEGKLADAAKTEERVDAAAAARADDGLRNDVKAKHYRD